MTPDIIKEYLVSIGFDVDKKGFSEAQKSFGKIEQALNSLFKKLSESGAFKKLQEQFKNTFDQIGKQIGQNSNIQKGVEGLSSAFEVVGEAAIPVMEGIGVAIEAVLAFINPLVAGILAAVAALLILSKVTYDFMAKTAKADMQVQKLALSLFTTVKNARSLKAVMDSMGIGSIEELRAVALNPELRAQFMSLRKTAAGLEGGADVQQGFKNIRAAGLETNRLGVIFNYFWQNLGGKLGHTLAGPLKAFEKLMATFNKLLVENMPAITDTIAGLFAIGGTVVEALFKILNLVLKIVSLFNWVGKLIALGVEILYGTFSGKLPYSLGKAAGQAISAPVHQGLQNLGKLFGGKGGINTHGLNLGNTGDFLKRLAPNLPGFFDVTSAKENRGHGPTSHASGNKFDLGFAGKSLEQIYATMFALQGTPGFVFGGLENKGHTLSGTRIDNILQEFARRGGNKKLFGDQTNSGTTGPHVDVLTKPVSISFNIHSPITRENANYFADAALSKFKDAMNIRSNTSATV